MTEFDLSTVPGIDANNPASPTNLIAMRNHYEFLVAKIGGATEKTAETAKNLRAKVSAETLVAVDEFRTNVIDACYKLFGRYPESALVLADALNAAKDYASNEADYFVRQNMPKRANTDEAEEILDQAAALKTQISALFEAIKNAPAIFGKLPENLPTKSRQVKGGGTTTVIDMSRLPDLGGSIRGRGAVAQRLTYIVDYFDENGEETQPAQKFTGIRLDDLCREHLSNPSEGIIVTPKMVRELIKSSGQDMFPKGGGVWCINILPGVNLSGSLPTGTEVPDEDEDE